MSANMAEDVGRTCGDRSGKISLLFMIPKSYSKPQLAFYEPGGATGAWTDPSCAQDWLTS